MYNNDIDNDMMAEMDVSVDEFVINAVAHRGSALNYFEPKLENCFAFCLLCIRIKIVIEGKRTGKKILMCSVILIR